MITPTELNPSGKPHSVLLGRGLIDDLGRSLKSRSSRIDRVALVTDQHVRSLYGQRAADSLASAGISTEIIEVPRGEAAKSNVVACEIYERLARLTHERGEPIIALGGGAVGDVAGFVAATWHRGVPFVQCPTTLEADIDAAIGAKTAINHPAGKNLIGAFHTPLFVSIDPNCLKTLPDREFRAALAESVKHAVVSGEELLLWHERNSPAIVGRDAAVIDELIARNVRVKCGIVANDPREEQSESVGRAALNLGHTIGHALESHFAGELRHGEAVALGLIAALDMAVLRLGFSADDRDRIVKLLSALGLATTAPARFNGADIIRRLLSDKKRSSHQARFVLPVTIGRLAWYAPDPTDVAPVIERIQPA